MGDLGVHDRETGERGRETNFAEAWQRALQNALNLSYTIGCMLLESRGKRLCFHVRSVLYLIPPHH